MKIYHAQGESRSFSFSAFATTQEDAKKAIMRAFKIHAKQYNLEPNWWKENADYWINEMEVGKVYRDNEEINA